MTNNEDRITNIILDSPKSQGNNIEIRDVQDPCSADFEQDHDHENDVEDDEAEYLGGNDTNNS